MQYSWGSHRRICGIITLCGASEDGCALHGVGGAGWESAKVCAIKSCNNLDQGNIYNASSARGDVYDPE